MCLLFEFVSRVLGCNLNISSCLLSPAFWTWWDLLQFPYATRVLFLQLCRLRKAKPYIASLRFGFTALSNFPLSEFIFSILLVSVPFCSKLVFWAEWLVWTCGEFGELCLSVLILQFGTFNFLVDYGLKQFNAILHPFTPLRLIWGVNLRSF